MQTNRSDRLCLPRIFQPLSKLLLAVCFVSLNVCLVEAQTYTGMLTWHNDLARTGQNLQETILNPTNVNSTTFGKLFSFPVDGQIFGQPLYVNSVVIPGKGTFNVVYVTTENDSVFALDADGVVTSALWSDSVIDPGSGTMYLVAATKENGKYVQRLHALDITSGAEKFGGPVVIKASVKGT